MKIRRARPDEAHELSRLALRSKAMWGYDADFLDAVREELTWQPQQFNDHPAFVAVDDGRVVGFSALKPLGEIEIELDALFIEPESARRGIGQQLFAQAIGEAREAGYRHVIIHGDPNADAFYCQMGAVQIGTTPSGSIPGRRLPLYRYALFTPEIQIESLAGHPERIDELVSWFAAEWPDYADRVGRAAIRESFENPHEPRALPQIWIAAHGSECLGTIALRESWDVGSSRRTPWLAGLYVRPEYRERGVGGRLVTHLVLQSGGLGYTSLFAGLRRRSSIFSEEVWPRVEELNLDGDFITIVERPLGSP